jgi:hypothetical protein
MQEFILGRVGRALDQRTAKAHALAGLHLAFHIGAAGAILTHQYSGQVGRPPSSGLDPSSFLRDPFPDGIGGADTVK